MPRNTRNVWLSAHIDGRSTELKGGPASRDGGLSATILQRSKGGIGDERLRIASHALGSGTIRTDVSVDTADRRPSPALMLATHRDEPGATVTLDVPGLTDASEYSGAGQTSAPVVGVALFFRTEAERDAFLALLPAWREAHESAEVSA